MSEIPESDAREGAPHPRFAAQVFGHGAAEDEVVTAFGTGRMHHAWLITGPEGIGKASLAWRIARFLLTAPEPGGLFDAPPVSLETDPESDTAHRMRALAEPGLMLIRRPWDDKTDKLRTEIPVDEVRRLAQFFHLTAAGGGRRVAIIDAADDLNRAAANALLKLLEEPPPGAVLLLVSHQPGALLPTIRSRCRVLRLAPLGPQALASALAQAGVAEPEPGLLELAAGSAGAAVRLATQEGAARYRALIAAFEPRPDRGALLAFAEAATGRNAEERTDLIFELIEAFLTRLALTGVKGALPEAAPGEARLMTRLSPDAGAARRWGDLAATLAARARHGRAVNVDASTLVLDLLTAIAAEAQ